MTIRTKYSIGDQVLFLYYERLVAGTVVEVTARVAETSTHIQYGIVSGTVESVYWIEEGRVYVTPEEAVARIMEFWQDLGPLQGDVSKWIPPLVMDIDPDVDPDLSGGEVST